MATNNSSANSNDLVVVGSSAGGIEALSIFVNTLPEDFPAPIVLAQHLDPNRPSNLDTILRRRTALAVQVVTSRNALQTGTIYVVPANRHVAITEGYVEVQTDHNKRPRPSVDRLLSTASEIFGERLIAVILTGSGSDGAAGAVDVKNAGGTVIVQDPQTARYPSMPLALPPTVVDFEVGIERIGSLLYDLLTGVEIIPSSEEKTEDTLRAILEQVSHQASIDFHLYKTSTILRRIGRRMAVTHCRTMHDYLEYLKVNPTEIGELVKSFLINVTQFFRDQEAFAYLRGEILPKLIAQARERNHTLRIWSAGCATGEEPYSLAMLLTDLLGVELPEWSIKIFATDLDEAAINFARRGLYSENLLKSVPSEYADHFFEKSDLGYRISKTLRQMVIFGQQDLSRSAPFPRIDLVLCRNVLIYFTPELQDYVLNQFAFSLSPGGYLLLGKAETVRPQQGSYELVNKHWKIYQCTGGALPMMKRPNPSNLNMPMLTYERQTTNRYTRTLIGKQHNEQETNTPPLEIGQLRHFNELLLRFLPVGVVVINRSYHILTANGAARRMLSLRDLINEQDFLHTVRGIPYTQVRYAIDSVFRERNIVTLSELELEVNLGGSGRFISLSIAPMQLETSAPDLVAISIVDATDQVQTRRQLETIQVEQTQLMQELSVTNKRLNETNKELLDANEELQVANEELVLTHEELQASIEEFETTNEELQATNEELETNNEELQAANEELETTNEELRARSSELQEMTTLLESERVQLTEMVELAPFYIMVLRGPNLLVEAFNPRYGRLLREREVKGRPLEIVFEMLWEAGFPIVRLAHEVYQQDIVRITPRILTRIPIASGENIESYFVYTLVPSHDAHGRVSGIIIYAVDETEQRVHAVEEELEKFRLIFDYADVIALALYDTYTTNLLMASPRYLEALERAYSIDHHAIIGHQWQELTTLASNEEATSLWNEVLTNRMPLHLSEAHWKTASDQQETIWDYNLIPIRNATKVNEVRFILVSAIEITEQVRVRREMEQLNRLRDDFLSMTSHELRTPLTTILGNSEILKYNLQKHDAKDSKRLKDEQTLDILDKTIQQASRLNRLIGEMLDITRLHSEDFQLKYRENVNIVKLMQQVAESQSQLSKRIITLDTTQESILATTDEARLEQILNNLIGNAVKYSPQDTPIALRLDILDNKVIVAVADKGSGINEEEKKHIFERFYRANPKAKAEGLGLGLYITHELITRMGGNIWLESQPGQGSTFYFSLPLQPK